MVRFLRKLASQGQAILCTIHQPSSLLFESFDRLLLLERGGRTVYFGDIGADSQVLRDYFAAHGAECPGNVNPAEFMLDAIGAGLQPMIGDRDWNDVWLDSEEYRRIRADIDAVKAAGLAKPLSDDTKTSTYATSFWYQLGVVTKRNNVALWRSPDYQFTRLFVHIFISLVSTLFVSKGQSGGLMVPTVRQFTFPTTWQRCEGSPVPNLLHVSHLSIVVIFSVADALSLVSGPLSSPLFS